MTPSHIPENSENQIESSEPSVGVAGVGNTFKASRKGWECSTYVMASRNMTDSHQGPLKKDPDVTEDCPSSSRTAVIPSSSVGSRPPASWLGSIVSSSPISLLSINSTLLCPPSQHVPSALFHAMVCARRGVLVQRLIRPMDIIFSKWTPAFPPTP